MSLKNPTPTQLERMAKRTAWDGREVGYKVYGPCEFPNCNRRIDRGLAFVCGDSPESPDGGCGKFFCGDHLAFKEDTSHIQLCPECRVGSEGRRG